MEEQGVVYLSLRHALRDTSLVRGRFCGPPGRSVPTVVNLHLVGEGLAPSRKTFKGTKILRYAQNDRFI